MENEKKFLLKKRQKESLSIENLKKDFSIRDIKIKQDINTSIKSDQDSNSNKNLFINKAPSLKDFYYNNSNNSNNNINISKNNSIFTLGKNMSFNDENNSEQILQENYINQNNQEQKNNMTKSNQNLLINNNSKEYSPKSEEEEEEIDKNNNKNKINTQSSHNNAFGLKEISKRVKEIIKQNGKTTYKAISDQIVKETNIKNIKDEKNKKKNL